MATSAAAPQGQTFINGKGQIVEMLAIMSADEREKLLNTISLRDSALAMELRQRSLSISILSKLDDDEIRALQAYLPAQVWGLAIRDRNEDLQRRSLRLANRAYAEEAYNAMRLNNISPDKIKKAQQKVVEIIINLSKRNLITIQ